jgi:hypothetical protein
MDKTLTLINCLDHPVFVHTVSGLVKLTEGFPPHLLTIPEGDHKIKITVPGDSTLLTEMHVYDGVKIYGGLDIPPVVEGLTYLVSVPTLFEFPERKDFVAPAMWAMPTEYVQGEKSEFIHILSGITRHPFHVLSVDGTDDFTDLFH